MKRRWLSTHWVSARGISNGPAHFSSAIKVEHLPILVWSKSSKGKSVSSTRGKPNVLPDIDQVGNALGLLD